MISPLFLVIVVVLVDDSADVSAASSVARAARTALPTSSSVVVRSVPSTDDEAALAVERRESADGVAVLTTPSSDSRRARLRVHRRADGVWLDREIVFETGDDPAERGRTLGFAVASMFPDAAPSPIETPTRVTTAPDFGAPAAPAPRVREVPSPPHPAPLRAVLDATALAAVGLGGYAGGLGGRAGLGYALTSRTTIRLDGSFRSAEVPPAQATSLILTAGPAVAFDFFPTSRERPLGLAGRIAALAMLHVQSHLSDEPAPVRQTRWLPGAQASVEAPIRLSDSAAILLGTGIEAAFGRTDVFLHSRRVAVVPPFRLLADLGVRVRF